MWNKSSSCSNSKLHELLDDALAFGPEYRGGLSSHLPMALQAMHSLGATDEQLTGLYERYRTRLTKAPHEQAANLVTEPPQLGRIEHFAPWQTSFEPRLREEGPDAVLRAVLPMLMQGAAGAAFHGLIRTAHAVCSGHQREIAAGLAYWASRHQPVTAESTASLGVDEWMARLTALALRRGSAMPQRTFIFQSIDDWAGLSAFKEVAGALDASALPLIARVAARTYAETRNFTVLHVVTAIEAAHRLEKWLAPSSNRALLPALAAGFLASEVLADEQPRRRMPEGSAAITVAWEAYASAAIAQADEHVIKLIEACRAQDRRHPNPVWKLAAARALDPM